MARGNKYSKSAKSKRRQWRKKNSKKSLSISKLADKKINTLWEKRMQEISQDQRVSLVSRRYFSRLDLNPLASFLYGLPVVNPAGNEICHRSNNWDYTEFTNVNCDPLLYVLTAIQKCDVSDPLNAPIPGQPDTDGVNQGMIIRSQHDRRNGNHIKITAISMEFRLKYDMGISTLHSGMAAETQYNHLNNQIKATAGRCNIYYKLVSVPTRSQYLPLDKDDAAHAAIMDYSCQRFGYSSQLDKDDNADERKLKYTTLAKGTINMNCKVNSSTGGQDIIYEPDPHSYDQTTYPTVQVSERRRTVTVFKKFDKPIQIDYEPRDQNGNVPDNKIIYLCVKSDVDNKNAADQFERDVCPKMSVCTKVYYFEP